MPDDRTELLMRLAHEMLDALKRIWDRRQHARGQIFANEVDAIMAEIRLSHDDFLSILNSLKRILRQLLHR
jgi:hypothetical protein